MMAIMLVLVGGVLLAWLFHSAQIALEQRDYRKHFND
jgi:hypothetical protein